MRTYTIAGAVIGAIAGISAFANAQVSWNAARQFDNGVKPSAVVVPLMDSGLSTALLLQVHNASTVAGPEWYSAGISPSFGSGGIYDHGFASSLAFDAQSSDKDVVEVHQAGDPGTVGPLWYKPGKVTTVKGAFTWSPGAQYDNGANPAVAAADSLVVEVHQGEVGVGDLWYDVGTFVNPAPVVNWSAGHMFDKGMYPVVAMTQSSGGDIFVIEVHQASDHTGPLWYSTAFTRNNGSATSIPWTDAVQYDTAGSRPSIAIYGHTVLEVHQGQDGVGPLLYKTGTINFTNKSFSWDGIDLQYDDNGLSPSVATNPWTGEGVEVHQTTTGTGPLWQRGFVVSP